MQLAELTKGEKTKMLFSSFLCRCIPESVFTSCFSCARRNAHIPPAFGPPRPGTANFGLRLRPRPPPPPTISHPTGTDSRAGGIRCAGLSGYNGGQWRWEMRVQICACDLEVIRHGMALATAAVQETNARVCGVCAFRRALKKKR